MEKVHGKSAERYSTACYRKILPANAAAIAAEETGDVEAGVAAMAATAIP